MRRSKPISANWFEYARHGDADVLEEKSGILPPPGDSDVTVEVITTAINHAEVRLRNGDEPTWADVPFPRRSGSDFAGIVVAVGPDVHGFPLGSEVIGHTRAGAHATHVTVPAASLVLKPRSVSWEVAGGMFLAGVTAMDVLDDLRIEEGDTVVVSAAAGGVGSIQVQLAKHRGAKVIGTCGDRNFDYLRQLGISPVRYGDGLLEKIRRIAQGPVTAYIDNFGKDGAHIADDLGVPETRYRSADDRTEIELRLLDGTAEGEQHGTLQLSRLTALAQRGAFRTLVSGLYPLSDITDAYEDLAKLHARGKVVLATHPVTPYQPLKAREVHEAGA